MSVDEEAVEGASLKPDAVLEMTQTSESQGAVCAVLTPAIKAKLRGMAAGQVLEVRASDPTAREDIASWCRLSGHQLLAAHEEPPGSLRVYLRKKRD